jgi:hypothetical protein
MDEPSNLSKALQAVGGFHAPYLNLEIPDSVRRQREEKEQNVRSINLLAAVAEASFAGEFCKRLEAQIKAFDESLDQDHEVGVRLVTFGQAITFHVSDLGYHNPSLIFFYGETDGQKVQLIQHVSQISFVLLAMRKPDPEKPRRPFGFKQGGKLASEAVPEVGPK